MNSEYLYNSIFLQNIPALSLMFVLKNHVHPSYIANKLNPRTPKIIHKMRELITKNNKLDGNFHEDNFFFN